MMKIVRISGFVLAAWILTLLQLAEAQQLSRVPRIGYLAPRSVVPKEFKQGLRELGYIEGQNIIIEPRFAEGKFQRFPQLAAELVQLNVDIIATLSTPAAKAAKKATSEIPIVMLAAGHPVDRGLVTNLARPGGNITGLTATSGTGTMTAKRLELLKKIVPGLSLVAVLWDPSRRDFPQAQKRAEQTARVLGLKIQSLEVRNPDDLKSAFQAAVEEGAQGLTTFRHAPILRGRKRIVALATKGRLPAVYIDRSFVTEGGLMSYGTNYAELYRRQATYVDKVLKGADPSNLPVEQPVKFELFINLNTAKQMGFTIPSDILYQADRVIR